MAVIQRFTVGHPYTEDTWELTRAEAEQLAADLHEALGSVPAGLADDLYRIEQKIDDQAGRLDRLTWTPDMDLDEGALTEVMDSGEPHATQDVDEVLARLQTLAAGPPGTSPSWTAAPGRNLGSGIGNLPS